MEKFIDETPLEEILESPEKYPWNIVLRRKQLSQDLLMEYSDYCDIKDIVRFQKSATYLFIRSFFEDEVAESLDIDWDDVKKYCAGRN